MAVVCDPQVLANEAHCFNECIQPGDRLAVIIDLLCLMTGTTCDPNQLANDAHCFSQCIAPGDELSVVAYVLCKIYSGGGGGFGVGVYYPNTLADLKAIPTVGTTPVQAFMRGYLTRGDGLNRIYYWDAASTTSDLDPFGNQLLNVVRPNDVAVGAPGRWIEYS